MFRIIFEGVGGVLWFKGTGTGVGFGGRLEDVGGGEKGCGS